MKFLFLDEHQGSYDVVAMAKLLGVSPSGYYEWRRRSKSPRNRHRLELARAIEDIHRSSRGAYGSPRIFKQLKALGYKASRATVERLMRENGIRSKRRRRFRVVTTDSKHSMPVAQNHMAQQFEPTKPNEKWTADITYIPTKEGWLYLAVILDLYSRRIVGWSMDERMPTELTLRALRMALESRDPGEGLMHHSDRGSQYAAGDYRRLLDARRIVCSMSRKGNCYDNAVTESFFGSLKSEFVHHETFETRAEARTKIFEWIEVFYNRTRMHSTLGFMSPEQYERVARVA
jgi:transposase InsO family protein